MARPVHVIATIEVSKGRRAEFLAAFLEMAPAVRAEEGCLGYEPCVDVATGIPFQPPPREDVVVVVEKWRDAAALQAHLVAPHVTKFLEQWTPAVTGLTLHVVEAV